jgi:hypothetical protein
MSLQRTSKENRYNVCIWHRDALPIHLTNIGAIGTNLKLLRLLPDGPRSGAAGLDHRQIHLFLIAGRTYLQNLWKTWS